MVSHVFPLVASFSNTVNTMEGNGNKLRRKGACLFLTDILTLPTSELPVAEGLILPSLLYRTDFHVLYCTVFVHLKIYLNRFFIHSQ